MTRAVLSALGALAITMSASAQNAPAAERWLLSYDRVTAMQVAMHGPRAPVIRPERSRLTLAPAKGDSVTGQLFALATEDSPEHLIGEVRGVRKQATLTLRVYKPQKPMGFVATQWDAVMIWMRETMHGIVPTYATLQLTIAADEVTGTRSVVTVDGATADGPRPVTGRREKP